MNKVTWLLALACLVGGCRTRGPRYAYPVLDLPAAHRDLGSTGPVSAADQAWWEVFEDPVLQRLVRDALAFNQDLELAAGRVEESRARVGLAASEGRPTVDFEAGVSRGQSSEESFGVSGERVRTNLRAALGASWELDLWGRVRRSSQAAWADYLATEEGRRAVLVALIADVAQAYFELLTLDWQLRITHETIAARRSTRDLFQRRLDGGVGSELEVARAGGDLAGVEADEPALLALIALKENQLSLLLGRMPGGIERGTPLDAQRLAPEVPAGLPSTLLERRPDVKAAAERLRAAVARVGVAQADFLPRVSLTGALGLESRELSTLGNGEAGLWSLGAGLVAPLLNGGRLKAEEQAACARVKQAEAAWRLSAQSAFRDVADALAVLRRSREVSVFQAAQVKARRRGLELGTKRFEGELASYFEVLDAQRELFPAELLLAVAKRSELLAVVRLYRALGGGWNAELPHASTCERPQVAPPRVPCVGGAALPAQPSVPQTR